MVTKYPIEQIRNGGASQKVKLTFCIDEYQATYFVLVGGNCTGASILNAAISNLYDSLDEANDDGVCLVLKNPQCETKLVYDEDELEEQFLEELLIGFEIISVNEA